LEPEESDRTDIMRDENGNFYEASEGYYKKQMDSHHISMDREIELRLAKELLDSKLSRLSGRQRDVMYYTILGYQQEEIAKQLNISLPVVREHLERATKKLAKWIEGNKQILKEGLTHGTKDTDTSNDKSQEGN
jgi:RNA polymerase sigma factor (sigma-70 family)